MKTSLQPTASDWLAKAQGLKSQFENLDLKDAHLWHALPKVLLCSFIGLFTLAAAWFFYLSSLETEFEDEQAVEITLRAEFEKKLIKAVSLEGLKRQREQVQQYVVSLERQLPSKSEMAALLSDINQAGVGRGLQFELFKPGTEVVKDYYAELPISLRISGSFHDMGLFVADIAHLPRIVTLSNISLTPKPDGTELSLEATAKTYRYLDPEEIQAQRQAQQKIKGSGR